MASSSVKFTRVDNLVKPQGFVQWSRRAKAVIIREDPTLLLFKPQPAQEVENHTEWVSANSKTKPTLILCLGDAALAKTRNFVDGDATENSLWDELERIYTMF